METPPNQRSGARVGVTSRTLERCDWTKGDFFCGLFLSPPFPSLVTEIDGIPLPPSFSPSWEGEREKTLPELLWGVGREEGRKGKWSSKFLSRDGGQTVYCVRILE